VVEERRRFECSLPQCDFGRSRGDGPQVRAAHAQGRFSGRLHVEHDRDRAVVLDLDEHPRAEDAGCDLDALGGERRAEGFVDRLGLLGRGRVGEARAVPLLGVGDQGELANDERRPAGVEQAAVEAAGLVLEDAEARDTAGEVPRASLVVVAGDAEEDAETGSDLTRRLALDADAGARDALDDRPQARSRMRSR